MQETFHHNKHSQFLLICIGTIVIIIITMVLMLGFIVVTVSWQNNKLPLEKDATRFAIEHNPGKHEAVNLRISQRGLGFGGGRVIKSPLFPYSEIETTQVLTLAESRRYSRCEERYLNIDHFWKIFWVEIVACGENTKFFGPYKLLH